MRTIIISDSKDTVNVTDIGNHDAIIVMNDKEIIGICQRINGRWALQLKNSEWMVNTSLKYIMQYYPEYTFKVL